MQIIRNQKGQFDKNNNSGRRFTHEASLGNQHAKGNPPNRTSFKPGDKVMEKHPCWKGGIQKHRDGLWRQIAPGKRVKNARYVYEQIYGEVPAGHVIYHQDGNKYNDDPSNLIAITRAELVKLNKPT